MEELIPSVTELTVTILALKVGKKQFTKQLFSQLPKMDFCGDGGRVREGIKPWGVVRPDSIRGGRWLVFESDGVLYRTELVSARSQSEIDREKRILEQEGHPGSYLDWKLKQLNEEPERAKHHAAMSLLPQLFIGV